MIKHLKIFGFALLLMWAWPDCSYSQQSKSDASITGRYESIRARYLKLRNTDRQISKRSEWESVLRQLTEFVEAYPRSKEAPTALLHTALMNEEIFKRFEEVQYLDAAIQNYIKLARNYPANDSADDALFKLAELFIREKEDRAKGISYLEQIISEFPESDMAEAARIRIRDLKSNRTTNKVNNPDKNVDGRVIVIDPGHGGEDLGAVGVGGLYEKDVTLLISLEVKRILEERTGIVVRLTRDKDEFVPLMDRTSFANDFEAEIFVSLHVNASPSKQLNGFEVYYLDNTGDKASKALAERENASIHFEGAQADIQYMLSDLIQNVKLEDSIRLAETLKRSIIGQLRAAKFEIKDLGVKKAPFYVLVGAHMPCVLVEMSFIDHSIEGANLGKKEYRQALAEGVSRGIINFLGL